MEISKFCWMFLLLGAGCAGMDETPFKEIDRLRVLAIGSDDATLVPNQTTTVRALVVPRVEGEPIEYVWSWCPLTTGQNGGYTCAISREELQQAVNEATGGMQVIEIPDYRLGNSSTAEYSYELPVEAFQAFCDSLGDIELPTFAGLPDCGDTFPITIQLRVSGPDNPDPELPSEVFAVKELDLLINTSSTAPGELNSNPVIDGLQATLLDANGNRVGDAFEVVDGTSFERDRDYLFEAQVDQARSSELFTQIDVETGERETINESLTITWFIDAGDSEFTRTGFIPGTNEFNVLIENEITFPRAVDYPSSDFRMFLVIRDQRRATTWIERRVVLQ